MTRRGLLIALGAGVLAVGLGWVLMVNLERMLRVIDRTPPPVTDVATPAQPTTPEPPAAAVPRITATLYFASEDGRGLVAVQQEVPLAEGTVAQARALVEAQLAATAPPPLVSTIPEGTTLRGLFVSERNQAFVDLDAAVRDKHPGGSMNELFTVYTIVNTITTNLRDVETVQLLINGREVDTLAGHVDLRRPLRKNETLITQ
jgi:spore germination protein GerM